MNKQFNNFNFKIKRFKAISYLDKITVKGARVHNLKNLDLEIPRDKLVVFTGLSGSGKSSLAFDTIYAEGQRRFMETLSAYARQFIGDMEKPDVDKIDGLSPAISIEQKTISHNPRSTVGTLTEIYDFLRLLYARCGIQFSPDTGKPVTRQSLEQIFSNVMKLKTGTKLAILAPLVKGRKGIYKELFDEIATDGFTKVRVDGEILDIADGISLSRYKTHDIEVIVDRVVVNKNSSVRIKDSLEIALRYGDGIVIINDGKEDKLYSEKLSDAETGRSFSELNPNSFSFNSPYGRCPVCSGLGTRKDVDPEKIFPDKNLSFEEGGIAVIGKPKKTWMSIILKSVLDDFIIPVNTPVSQYSEELTEALLYGIHGRKIKVEMEINSRKYSYNVKFDGLIKHIDKTYTNSTAKRSREIMETFITLRECNQCKGGRLKEDALWVKVADKSINEVTAMPINVCYDFIKNLSLGERQMIIAEKIIKEILTRLSFLLNVGLEYLTLNRAAHTLSGGEAQRIRLATQIGSQLTGVLYILDEPSIGLHQRDNIKLIKSLKKLRDIGNSVIVVEHDKEMIESADFIVDLGPKAGEHGGEVVATGHPKKIKGNSLTAEYINGKKNIPYLKERRKGNGKEIVLTGAKGNNLKDVTLKLPLGKFVCITGVSGSGKSSLINDTLYKILMNEIYKSNEQPLTYNSIKGLSEQGKNRKEKIVDKVIEIDQEPIGRTPRSNPATYTGLFSHIREIFAALPDSKIKGYKVGRFSFNVKSGRCETCEGDGLKKIEMNFLPDVYVTCDVCKGRRYNNETLRILYKGKSIADVLDMTVEDAVEFFKAFPSLHRKLKTLYDVGLGYIRLGQQATTLSGGEAQRVKLATELAKVQTGRTIYLLDEPTTGLHFEDINMLLNVLNKLTDKGNTVVVIEHNLDIIKNADWIIDLGPEGGDDGGYIIAEGTPEEIIEKFQDISYTARYLKKEIGA